MYLEDICLLCCPITGDPLTIKSIYEQDSDGEIIRGELCSVPSENIYLIANGIPRFVTSGTYNESWNYKWTQIDKGEGLNYRILDKNDLAYKIHDLFDRNSHEGEAFEYARNRLVLDIGCGIGQYSIKLAEEYQPEKIVSMDLTGGVDIFRKIILERYPQYKRKILIVQASVFEMPFPKEQFDYVFSLGVLMHTGNTREAIRQASKRLKNKGQLNIWVYSAFDVHLDINEPDRAVEFTLNSFSFLRQWIRYYWSTTQLRFFRLLPHGVAVFIIKIFSSNAWYHLTNMPILGRFFQYLFDTVQHPNRNYRFINNYDGWYNQWMDTWTVNELFPTLKESQIVIRGLSDWKVGIWGEKNLGFYRNVKQV